MFYVTQSKPQVIHGLKKTFPNCSTGVPQNSSELQLHGPKWQVKEEFLNVCEKCYRRCIYTILLISHSFNVVVIYVFFTDFCLICRKIFILSKQYIKIIIVTTFHYYVFSVPTIPFIFI